MKNKVLFIAFTLLSAACSCSSNNVSENREILDVGEQQAITTYANSKQGTMSVLYGNSAALQEGLNSTGKHKPGEVFTLATWKRVGNPRWYGSYLNGRIITVETVTLSPLLNNGIFTEYKLVKGSAPRDVNGQVIDSQDRINLILSLKPSVFP